MFEVGEYVVHGNNGVCKVEAIQTMDNLGTEGKRVYYILVPIYSSGSKFFVPTDSKKVVMRSIMTKQEVKELLEELDEIDTLFVENDKTREETYKKALRSCDSRQWVKLIKTSYQRNQSRIKRGKKATSSDERYLHLAEDILFGEMAIPLEMTRGEAEDYFISKVKGWEEEAITIS